MSKALLQIRLSELLYGLSTYLPLHNLISRRCTGGTNMSAYCYSVWLRHMVMAEQNNLNTSPRIVAELGPGDSLGIGLTALVFGAEKYYAFDVVEFAEIKKNLRVFEDIVAFAKKKEIFLMKMNFPKSSHILTTIRFQSIYFRKKD